MILFYALACAINCAVFFDSASAFGAVFSGLMALDAIFQSAKSRGAK